ncbi:MAG: ferritin-like domain-containing protein [Polyangiaceae bacterium]
MTAWVRAEWRARIAAEYTSATITQSYVLWLMQAGAPPDLIDAGLSIVADELVHSRMSHDVYVAAGGSEPPRLDRNALGLMRTRDALERDLTIACVRVFCLGETVAVPLFKHLRERCTEPSARAALDRILRDEARHRDFGWDVLDWLMATTPETRGWVEGALPKLFGELESSYGDANAIVASDDGAITDEERSWGLAPPREYAEILDRTFEREWIPRFLVRKITALKPAPS